MDPWRPDTPHSDVALNRQDTVSRPFKLIPGVLPLLAQHNSLTVPRTGGVHHWDENGLRNPRDEPDDIKKIHAEMIYFVREWLDAWIPPLPRH